jgi:homoserine dehydrogenase
LGARQVHWTDSLDAVIGSDADIVVEVMGGLQPAGDLIRRALQAGNVSSRRTSS